jgi:hypothetical protein
MRIPFPARPFLVVMGTAILAAFALGCAKKDKKAKATGSVGVANNVTAASGLWELEEDETASGERLWQNYNEKQSFNPSSLKLSLTSIQLCKQGNDGTDSSGNYGCTDTRNSVRLTGSKQIELMDQVPFSTLAGFSDDSIDKNSFGTYVLAMIGYDGFVDFSGTSNLDGATQTVTDAQVGSGSGITVKPVTVDDSHSLSLQLYFDVHAPAFVLNSLGGSSAPGSVPVSGSYYAGLSNWSMLAYLGAGTPTLESYNVKLSTTDFGSTGSFVIRVSVLRDNNGQFYTASWHSEFAAFQEALTTPFNICDLDPGLTKANADGTYTLSSSTAANRCSTSIGVGSVYVVTFPAFQLAAHSGTVTIASKTYNYTATPN